MYSFRSGGKRPGSRSERIALRVSTGRCSGATQRRLNAPSIFYATSTTNAAVSSSAAVAWPGRTGPGDTRPPQPLHTAYTLIHQRSTVPFNTLLRAAYNCSSLLPRLMPLTIHAVVIFQQEIFQIVTNLGCIIPVSMKICFSFQFP